MLTFDPEVGSGAALLSMIYQCKSEGGNQSDLPAIILDAITH